MFSWRAIRCVLVLLQPHRVGGKLSDEATPKAKKLKGKKRYANESNSGGIGEEQPTPTEEFTHELAAIMEFNPPLPPVPNALAK